MPPADDLASGGPGWSTSGIDQKREYILTGPTPRVPGVVLRLLRRSDLRKNRAHPPPTGPCRAEPGRDATGQSAGKCSGGQREDAESSRRCGGGIGCLEGRTSATDQSAGQCSGVCKDTDQKTGQWHGESGQPDHPGRLRGTGVCFDTKTIARMKTPSALEDSATWPVGNGGGKGTRHQASGTRGEGKVKRRLGVPTDPKKPPHLRVISATPRSPPPKTLCASVPLW